MLAAVLPGIVKSFPWPKSMRWGANSAAPEPLRWVRPLHSILCTFGAETEEPEVVRFSVDGIAAGDTTRGHRFMAPEPFRVRRFDDYVPALERAKVVLDPERRRDIIRARRARPRLRAGARGVEDEALLAEVAGLVEWPVVLMGRFDESFLAIPPEVIRATIRANQKCFVARRPDGALAEPLRAGGEHRGARRRRRHRGRQRARGAGAAVATPSSSGSRTSRCRWKSRVPKLDSIVFHEKLGTQGERVKRIAALARELAPLVGADPDKAERAATLAKADLVSEMVGEFPELQGLMGRYYATRAGREPGRRGGDRGALQAAGAERPRAERAGVDRGGAGRQARHAGRLLGHRREADGVQGPVCAAARGAGGDPDRAREWAAAAIGHVLS